MMSPCDYYFKESSFLRDELKNHLKEKLEPGREYLLNYGIENAHIEDCDELASRIVAADIASPSTVA